MPNLKLTEAERAAVTVLGDRAAVYEMDTGEEWISLRDCGEAVGAQRWEAGWVAYGERGECVVRRASLAECLGAVA
jgi:hypothetical protein